MSITNVNVRLTSELGKHLQQQTGDSGLYDNASEYLRDLIRQDLKSQQESWHWLKSELEGAIRADESSFINISAQDVISRNS
jgi:Arc/MetJ-type ribon-helix-helix transcriptional regulator